MRSSIVTSGTFLAHGPGSRIVEYVLPWGLTLQEVSHLLSPKSFARDKDFYIRSLQKPCICRTLPARIPLFASQLVCVFAAFGKQGEQNR